MPGCAVSGYSKLEIDEIPVEQIEQMGKLWKSVEICENM